MLPNSQISAFRWVRGLSASADIRGAEIFDSFDFRQNQRASPGVNGTKTRIVATVWQSPHNDLAFHIDQPRSFLVFAIFERAVEMFPRTIWLGIFGLLVLVGSVTAFGPYKWSTSLISSSSYTMHWNLTQDTIYIGLRGNSNGWLAVGFAQTASMAPADVVMGYFSGGTIHINDYYTTAHSTPTKDPNQDIEDKNGARNGSEKICGFSISIS